MQKNQIELDFGQFVMSAKLFDTEIARKFAEALPYQVRLKQWGEELYGSIGVDLGEEKPVESIPPGGIAYTNSGNYVCLFFGQTPAWAVEHIGQIRGEQWQQLVENTDCDMVKIRLKPSAG